jgi:hypothetical protein
VTRVSSSPHPRGKHYKSNRHRNFEMVKCAVEGKE